MDQAIRQKIPGKPRILVVPLDWGLGHTTRCIPLIRQLLDLDCTVILAGNARQSALLSAEFPGLTILPLEGYNVRYAATAAGLYSALLLQVPALLRSIRREHQWLLETCSRHQINAVISDNRYGLHHPAIPSVIITHQLNIRSGLGKWTDTLLRKKNYSYLNKFTACWVPDRNAENAFAGALSHPEILPDIPVEYIGPLSRFNFINHQEVKNHLLVLCSGPEPQRTHFENIMIAELNKHQGSATLVRGLPGDIDLPAASSHVTVLNHLPAFALQGEFGKAEFVIARSGYSTIMDLAAMRKKSILIPTPGQTEQEYLGHHIAKKNFAVCATQKGFNLGNALEDASRLIYNFPVVDDNPNILREIIRNTLLNRFNHSAHGESQRTLPN